MNDDYLWDKSGAPDPEVERLEKLLGRYQLVEDRQSCLSEVPSEEPGQAGLPVLHFRRRVWLALAATLILVVGGISAALALRFRWSENQPWAIVSVEGKPTIDGRAISSNDRLAVGQELVTDGQSRVTIEVARVGEVDIEPGSRVRLVATRAGRHRLQLERGRISARVWAPPFTFAVDTPAGLASDIGCVFDLDYDEGAGSVHVLSGWVDFDGDDRSSLIPQGAIAELRETQGPGTPFYADAPPELIAALRAFDFDGDRAALQRVIAAARPRDAMTLLHLLEHARREDRALLFDALSKLAPPPAGVTREGILARELPMLARWRQSIGLGGVKRWWLQWDDALR